MEQQTFTKPWYIFFLMTPTGISNGFVTVALPFLLTKNGFPVAVTAGIVAIGVSANLWRFVWGPIADISLSMRKWFWIGISTGIASLLLLCCLPFTVNSATILTVIVFISQVAATLTVLPINSIMAIRISNQHKGKASGWFQAGSLAGTGVGGGLGLWMATNYNAVAAGIVLAVVSILSSLFIIFIKDIKSEKDKTLTQAITIMGKDILAMIKVPVTLAVILLMLLPIGTGAMSNLWSAVAQDWKTDTNTVVLVTGLLSALASTVGCVIGGYIADRWNVWVAYLGSGILCAAITILIAMMPFTPLVYIVGVLAYAVTTGMIYAAFTAVILFAIGKKHVATKYSLLASLGNLPVVYMTAFNGWMHDKFNSGYMLFAEAALGILFTVLFFLLLQRMRYQKLIPAVV